MLAQFILVSLPEESEILTTTVFEATIYFLSSYPLIKQPIVSLILLDLVSVTWDIRGKSPFMSVNYESYPFVLLFVCVHLDNQRIEENLQDDD